MLPASVSGMAIARPKAVVNRACPMSPAKALGSFPCVCTRRDFFKRRDQRQHGSQQPQHGGGPHDGHDPGRTKVEIGQHLALEGFAQMLAQLLRAELRVLQGDDHQLRHGFGPIGGRVADFGHAVDVALLQLFVDLLQELRQRRPDSQTSCATVGGTSRSRGKRRRGRSPAE